MARSARWPRRRRSPAARHKAIWRIQRLCVLLGLSFAPKDFPPTIWAKPETCLPIILCVCRKLIEIVFSAHCLPLLAFVVLVLWRMFPPAFPLPYSLCCFLSPRCGDHVYAHLAVVDYKVFHDFFSIIIVAGTGPSLHSCIAPAIHVLGLLHVQHTINLTPHFSQSPTQFHGMVFQSLIGVLQAGHFWSAITISSVSRQALAQFSM